MAIGQAVVSLKGAYEKKQSFCIPVLDCGKVCGYLSGQLEVCQLKKCTKCDGDILVVSVEEESPTQEDTSSTTDEEEEGSN